MSTEVKNTESPCVRNCCLDQQDICLGCFRSLDEILQWSEASEQKRIEILQQAQQRKALRAKPGHGHMLFSKP